MKPNDGCRLLAILLACAALGFADRVSAEQGWGITGRMNVVRVAHTATRLDDGRVLVAGGSGSDYLTLNSAEVFDPATGTWTLTGSLGVARGGHRATLLPDGRVLVIGGWSDNAGSSSSAEIYDPDSGTWAPTGSMADARGSFTATALVDGTVLVVGGSRVLGAAEIYDPATGLWSHTGSLNRGRYAHTATPLADGGVLVLGGSDSDDDWMVPMVSAERYDPVLGTWTVIPGLYTGGIFHTATLLPSGNVLVAGFYSWQLREYRHALLFDPSAATWAGTAALRLAREGHTATLLPSGDVLVAGGHAWSHVYPSPLSVAPAGFSELFEAGSATWRFAGRPNIPRSGHTATLLHDGRVLIAGGFEFGLPETWWTTRMVESAEFYGDVDEECKNHYILRRPCPEEPDVR